MSWTIRGLLGAAVAAFLIFAPPEFRFSAGATAIAQDPAPATLTTFSGGAVLAKLARTQTTEQLFNASAVFSNVTGATLSRFVGALVFDTFNLSFSAECSKSGGGNLYIRVLDNGVANVVQPSDGFQVFCSSPLLATYAGTWVRRAGGGLIGANHTYQVQVRSSAGTARLDDWTFELVVYN